MLDVRPSRAEIEPVALDLIERRGAEVLSTARRHAVNDQDAEDAYQRGLEILLTKAPSVEEDVIVPWLKVVVKHEAYALARERARDLPYGPAVFDALPGDGGDGDDRAERIDRMRVGSEALSRLKPQETRCLVLLAQGYSYAQIQSATGFSYTKVNRCVAEGRKAFIARVRGIESGAECERWASAVVGRRRRRGVRGRHGRAAAAPARLRGVPGDAARLPRRAAGGCRAARAAGVRVRHRWRRRGGRGRGLAQLRRAAEGGRRSGGDSSAGGRRGGRDA